jgi:hypothetical protein
VRCCSGEASPDGLAAGAGVAVGAGVDSEVRVVVWLGEGAGWLESAEALVGLGALAGVAADAVGAAAAGWRLRWVSESAFVSVEGAVVWLVN